MNTFISNAKNLLAIGLAIVLLGITFQSCEKEDEPEIIPVPENGEVIILPGVFTVADPDGVVNSGDEKKVQFSRGNLYYDGTNWGFEAEQYYFRSYSGKAKCDENGYNNNSGTADGHWGFFGWSTTENNYGMSTSTSSSDFSGSFVDWGKAIDNNDTWTTLTGGANGEWKYLFDHHINVWGTCNNVPGRFIAPDGFAGNAKTLSEAVKNWEKAQLSGIVFLPATGYRDGSNVLVVGNYCFYWSSSAYNENYANSIFLFDNYLSPDNHDHREYGYCVRLVTSSGTCF